MTAGCECLRGEDESGFLLAEAECTLPTSSSWLQSWTGPSGLRSASCRAAAQDCMQSMSPTGSFRPEACLAHRTALRRGAVERPQQASLPQCRGMCCSLNALRILDVVVWQSSMLSVPPDHIQSAERRLENGDMLLRRGRQRACKRGDSRLCSLALSSMHLPERLCLRKLLQRPPRHTIDTPVFLDLPQRLASPTQSNSSCQDRSDHSPSHSVPQSPNGSRADQRRGVGTMDHGPEHLFFADARAV